MHLINTLEARVVQLDAQHLRRRTRPTQSPCEPHVKLNNRDCLALCSNDYLGLANHPAVVTALQEGAGLHGAGSGASHLISGHSQAHEALEHRLAGVVCPPFATCRTPLFFTGFNAHTALAPCELRRGESRRPLINTPPHFFFSPLREPPA